MKITIRSIIYIIFSTNFVFGQQTIREIFKVVDVNTPNKKELTYIKNENDLSNFNLPVDTKNYLSSNVDFKVQQLIFLPFFYAGPSQCKKTYFKYFLVDEADSSSILIQVHSVGEHAARMQKGVILLIPKKKAIKGVNFEHIPYNYGSTVQLDSICNYIYKKFEK